MHVCVLGAGIVGLATACQLNAAGHEVTRDRPRRARPRAPAAATARS